MRHAGYGLALILACVGCDACEDDEEATAAAEEAARGDVPPPETRLPSQRGGGSPQCLAFCRKSLECAQAEGREVPERARDCEVSCRPGGPHHAAPAGVWDCADAPCGQAFQACSMRAMMDHMRQSEVAVFPPTCVGLCNKVAWCAARTGQDPGPGTGDCEAACAEGGAYAEVPRREHGCALANCEDLAECRQGGAAAPAAP